MEMTLKELLIWLMKQGVSYQQLLVYLKKFIKFDRQFNRFNMADLKKIHESLRYVDVGKKPELNFYITQAELAEVKKLAAQTFMIGESVYPEAWLHLPQPPIVLFYAGDLELLKLPNVSIIGIPEVTDYGKKITHDLTKAICEHHICVVSGLGAGVDQIVHQTAIREGGWTIGILAGGLNHYFPRTNMPLQEEMKENQLVISEYLPDKAIEKHHFIMRNRLVAGLTPVTVVIEAKNGGGSLVTANYAVQFDKELLVLPGRITDPQAKGCNELIYNGATPIVSVPQAMREIYEILSAQRVVN
ncbi:DNA-protecting protein DprA [Aerococcaceae bacterium DSM 111022]|nr:DNA-protecting protein DprA [Aerococcaceae bacterium DSM 111022]